MFFSEHMKTDPREEGNLIINFTLPKPIKGLAESHPKLLNWPYLYRDGEYFLDEDSV